MSLQRQKYDQDEPEYRCDRCWSNKNINLYPKSNFIEEDAKGFVVLCDRCKSEVPKGSTRKEYEDLFMRFASIKEFILHFNAKNEKEAIEFWRREEKNEIIVRNEDEKISEAENTFDQGDSQVPLGYELNDGKFYISHDKAEIIREIFEKYLTGKTMEWIARHLDNNGDCSGMVWSVGKVRAILKDPFYAGYVLNGLEIVKAEHDAIIEKEIFNKVQQRIVRNIRNPKYRYKPMTLGE